MLKVELALDLDLAPELVLAMVLIFEREKMQLVRRDWRCWHVKHQAVRKAVQHGSGLVVEMLPTWVVRLSVEL